MSKHLSMLEVLLIALTCVVCWGTVEAAAAPGTSAPNVGQVDHVGEWVCPASATSPLTFTDIPDLSLALTTQGGPLLMMLTIDVPTFWAGGEGILFDPVIDGQQRSGDRLTVSRANTWSWPFSFSRVYFLAVGTQTFSGRLACLNNPAHLARAWLTVYELPAVKK
jgi:hypothetical protein